MCDCTGGVNNVDDFMKFIEMIHPFVDGIGINCGCPIKEQVREGIGAALMSDPDLVAGANQNCQKTSMETRYV